MQDMGFQFVDQHDYTATGVPLSTLFFVLGFVLLSSLSRLHAYHAGIYSKVTRKFPDVWQSEPCVSS
ncbi:hypothetical protein VNO78_11559 [Psophocarpus tetragonolobus]|uniref:Uncharacterized protein n=1 Tax=Psophocarpus tetragonolobus TaxID=3891 RepID=A0AAN9SMM8_PSOTE